MSNQREPAASLATAALMFALAARLPTPDPLPSLTESPTSTATTTSPEPTVIAKSSTGPQRARTFGFDHFDGVTVGVPHARVGPLTGMAMDGCPLDGHYRFNAWPGLADDAPWVLWTSGTATDPSSGEALVTEFGLQAGATGKLSAPYGPVGPSGLRLGTTAADVVVMFPEVVTSEYLAEYFNEIYTLHTVHIDSSLLVIATRNDLVVDIRWGAPTIAENWVHERCSEGPAPFDWQSEPEA